MEISEIGIQRLNSQHVDGKRLDNVKDLVGWMGAIQAQDLNSAKWAIGIRLPGVNESMVDESINSGEIIRTHVMRPTWHLVSSEDYLDMMKLTAPGIHVSLKTRQKQLELDESFFHKSNAALVKILHSENHLTREELKQELSKTIDNIDSSRMNHIILRAELDGLICSGKVKKRQQSYALVQERIKKVDAFFDKDKALFKLAQTYFTSHGPATLMDFNWWSGLSMSDCRKALEMVKHDFQSINLGSRIYWFKELDNGMKGDNTKMSFDKLKRLYLLPAYDEFLISYKDRSDVISANEQVKAVSSNGIFRPTIVLDGRVIGLWNKKVAKGVIKIIPDLFIKEVDSFKVLLSKAIDAYLKFYQLT